MIYYISDFHFGHKNILKFERNQFKTIEEHDNFIIQQYNKIIQNEDECWILGDIGGSGFNISKEYIISCFSKLKGYKNLILGNHDGYGIGFYNKLYKVKQVFKHPVFLNKRLVLSHEPIQINADILNVHGHLHDAKLNLNNYYNVNCHMINYIPVSQKLINVIISQLPKINNKFMNEWYADNYIFNKSNN